MLHSPAHQGGTACWTGCHLRVPTMMMTMQCNGGDNDDHNVEDDEENENDRKENENDDDDN